MEGDYRTLPLAGNGLWFLQPRHKLLDWFVGANHQTGFSTFEISVPSLPPAIVISDPKNVEHVLKNEQLFIKGTFFRSRSWDLFGNGIINADGDLWRVQRKAGLRFFSNANLKIFLDEALPPILDDTERYLDGAVKGEETVDMQQVFLELTTRLMGKMAYDMDMPASLPFSRAFDFASGAIGDRFQNPFWKIKEFVFGGRLRNAFSEVKRFGNEIVTSTIAKRLQPSTTTGNSVEDTKSLKSNLINSLLDHIPDQQVVADAAMNYLSAGRDTTAQALTWTLYLLLRHPEQQQRLIEELARAFPSALRQSSLQGVTYDVAQPVVLPYTYSIFLETLRLYPPVPFELKECVTPTTFPDGTWLPGGSVVIWVPWAMGRSHRIWGANSEQFKPDRWLSAAGSVDLQKSAFEFPVFNGGPRICLGKKLAELLAVAVLARLTWRYEFTEVVERSLGGCGEGGERKSQNSLTLPMEGGLPVNVSLRRTSPIRA
ncbi:MAG: hypothetical protein LQ346_001190 [Caloplaca aetnensis]|nr:MAG: hypothetical protein LQ346_001190 [Caloplaca aetnensis]